MLLVTSQGTIINKPNGTNLYTSDLQKDYTGEQVTAANFLSILSGNASAMVRFERFVFSP